MAESVEVPAWYEMFRRDLEQMEARTRNEVKTLASDIERRVTQEAFEAEKKFQNERFLMAQETMKANHEATLAAIELEKRERIDAIVKEADDRSTAIAAEQKDREELEASLMRAEAERKSQRRWTIGLMVSIGGFVLAAAATIIAVELPHWFGS